MRFLAFLLHSLLLQIASAGAKAQCASTSLFFQLHSRGEEHKVAMMTGNVQKHSNVFLNMSFEGFCIS
jgi:hypothetical protein